MSEETQPEQTSPFDSLIQTLQEAESRVEASPSVQAWGARGAERRGEEPPAPLPVRTPQVFESLVESAAQKREETAYRRSPERAIFRDSPIEGQAVDLNSPTAPPRASTGMQIDYLSSDAPPVDWSPEPQEIARLIESNALTQRHAGDLDRVWQAGRADAYGRGGIGWMAPHIGQQLIQDMYQGESAVQDQIMSEVPISRFPGVTAVNTYEMNEQASDLWFAKIMEERGLTPQTATPEQRAEIDEETRLRTARTMARVMQSGGRLLWTDPLDHDITEDLMNSGVIGTVFRPLRALTSPVRFGAMGRGRSDTPLGRTQLSLSRGQLKYESSLSLIGRMAPSTILAASMSTGTSPWSRESTEAIRAGEDIILHVPDIAEALGGEDPGIVAKGVAASLVLGIILFEPDIISLSLGTAGIAGKGAKVANAARRINRIANSANQIAETLRTGNITIREAATQLEALDPAFFRAVELSAGSRLNISGGTISPTIHADFKEAERLRGEATALRGKAEEAQTQWERFAAGEHPDFDVSVSRGFASNKLALEAAEADHAASLVETRALEKEKNAFLEGIGFSPEDAARITSQRGIPVDEAAAGFQERIANRLEARAKEFRKGNRAAFDQYERASTTLADLLANLQKLRGPHKGVESRMLTVSEAPHGTVASQRLANHPTIGQEVSFRTERGGWKRGRVEDLTVKGPEGGRFPSRHSAKKRDGFYEIYLELTTKGGEKVTILHPLRVTHEEGRAIRIAKKNFQNSHAVVFSPGGPYTQFRTFTDAADQARALAKSLRQGGEAASSLKTYERAVARLKESKKALKEVRKGTKGNIKTEQALLNKWSKAERAAAKKEEAATRAAGLRNNYADSISDLVESTRAFRAEGLERMGLDNPTLKSFLTSKKPWKAVSKLTADEISKFGHLSTDASVEKSFRKVMEENVRLNPKTREAEVDVAGMVTDLERIIGRDELEELLDMPQFSNFKKLLDDSIFPSQITESVRGGETYSDGWPLGFSISSTEVAKGIKAHSEDTDGLIDFLTKHLLDEDYREILKRIKPILSPAVETAVLSKKGMKSLGFGEARGVTRTRTQDSSDLIALASARSKGTGIAAEVVVHELLHAATTRRLVTAKLRKNQGTEISKAGRDIFYLWQSPRVQSALQEELTRFEKRARMGDTTGLKYHPGEPLSKLSEFIAYGMTNRQFQDVLQSIKLPDGKNAWSKFVDTIRRILGIPPGETNALSELFRATDDFMSASIRDLPDQRALGGLPREGSLQAPALRRKLAKERKEARAEMRAERAKARERKAARQKAKAERGENPPQWSREAERKFAEEARVREEARAKRKIRRAAAAAARRRKAARGAKPEFKLTPPDPEYKPPPIPRAVEPKPKEGPLPGQGSFDFDAPKPTAKVEPEPSGPKPPGDDQPPPSGDGGGGSGRDFIDGHVRIPYAEWGGIAQEVRTLISFGERIRVFNKSSAWGRAIFEAQKDLNLRSTKRGEKFGPFRHPKYLTDRIRLFLRQKGGMFDSTQTRVGEVGKELETAIIETERVFSRAQLELAEVITIKELGDTPTERMINFLDGVNPVPMKEGLSRWDAVTGNGSAFQKMKMQLLADTRLDPRLKEARAAEVEGHRARLQAEIDKIKRRIGKENDGLSGDELDDLLKGLSDDVLALVSRGERATDGIPKALVSLSRAWMRSYAGKPIQADIGIILAGITRGALEKAETYKEFSDLVRRGTYSILSETTPNVEKAHSMSASAIMLSATLGEFGHRIDKVIMGKIGAEEAADINRIFMGEFGDIKDLDTALENLNKLGMPLSQKEIKTFRDLGSDLRGIGSVQKTLVELGTREGGSSMVPKALIEQIEKKAGNIVKDLEALNVIARVTPNVDKALGTYMSLWRGSAVTGLIVPNPRYWTNNMFGDFSQMWMQEGAGFAARRSLINFPTNIPFYGRKLQEKSLFMAERVGGKSGSTEALPGMIEVMINPHLGRVFKGEAGELVTKNGDVITYDMLRKWAVEDGISESFIREELFQMYDRVGETWGGDTYKWWQKQIADHANLVQERQRVGMYADLIQRGVPRAEAAKRTKRALYDWSHGIAEWEARYIARNIPFWRFWRLSIAQIADAVMEPLVRPTGEIFKKAMLGNTKLARLRQQLHILPSLPEFIYQDNVDVGITTNERVNLIATQLYPDWMETRAKLGVLPMDPIRRQFWQETYDRQYSHEAILLPTITALDSADMMIGLTSGLGFCLGQIFEAMGMKGPSRRVGDAEARFFEPILGSMNPIIEPFARPALEKLGADLDYSSEGDFRYLSPTDEEVFQQLSRLPMVRSQMQFDHERGQWKTDAYFCCPFWSRKRAWESPGGG